MKITSTLAMIAAALLMAGCGAAETAAVAASQAELAAEQAKQAKAAQAKIEQNLEAAQEAAAKQREAAEQ